MDAASTKWSDTPELPGIDVWTFQWCGNRCNVFPKVTSFTCQWVSVSHPEARKWDISNIRCFHSCCCPGKSRTRLKPAVPEGH